MCTLIMYLQKMASVNRKGKRATTSRTESEKKEKTRVVDVDLPAAAAAAADAVADTDSAPEMEAGTSNPTPPQTPTPTQHIYQVGQGRRVQLNLSSDGSLIMIKRYYTAEERLRSNSGEECQTVGLEKYNVQQVLKFERKLEKRCDNLTVGRAANFRYSVGGDLFATGQEGTYVIHLRRFWLPAEGGDWKPTRNGVALRPNEFTSVLSLLAKLEPRMGWNAQRDEVLSEESD
jgi:hypothetical protein